MNKQSSICLRNYGSQKSLKICSLLFNWFVKLKNGYMIQVKTTQLITSTRLEIINLPFTYMQLYHTYIMNTILYNIVHALYQMLPYTLLMQITCFHKLFLAFFLLHTTHTIQSIISKKRNNFCLNPTPLGEE